MGSNMQELGFSRRVGERLRRVRWRSLCGCDRLPGDVCEATEVEILAGAALLPRPLERGAQVEHG